MSKVKLAISGCMGRMGQQLVKSSRADKNFKLTTLTENRLIKKKIAGINPSLNDENSFKNVDLIIDFTIPKCTFQILKIATKLKKRVVIGTTGFSKKEEIKISDNPNMYFQWYDGNTNYANPQNYPNVSIGLTSARSSGSFREKYLPREVNDKSPAIIEYPGIINSLDGGPSKESLSAQDWVYDKLYHSDYTNVKSYFFLNMNNDKIYHPIELIAKSYGFKD